MTTAHYDVMIIGTGPAGITAALYGARLGLKVVVFGEVPGGNTYMIESLENYPGFPGGVSGTQFGVQAFQQAQQAGAEFTMTRLQQLTVDQGLFTGTDMRKQLYTSPVAIVATGRTPRRLAVPNASVQGVHFCSLCDGPFYRGKHATLAVIGGGNAAAQHAITLSRIADNVVLVSRRREFQMDSALRARLEALGNVSLLPGTAVLAYEGEGTIDGITVATGENEREVIAVSAVFLAVGWKTNIKMLNVPVKTTAEGYLKTDDRLMTSCPGLFAAGDVRDTDMRQVLTACADGARAAKHGAEFLEEKIG